MNKQNGDFVRLKNAKIKEARQNAELSKIVRKINKTYQINNIKACFFTPCIYYLKAKHNIVYIGETTNIMERILSHINENKKVFDNFCFEPFNGSNLQRKEEEKRLIKQHKPFYNIIHNKCQN